MGIQCARGADPDDSYRSPACRSLAGSDTDFRRRGLESLNERRPGFSLEKNGFTRVNSGAATLQTVLPPVYGPVCPLCVALAPACGPRCVAPRPDFLIGRALASSLRKSDRFPRAIAFFPHRRESGAARLVACCSPLRAPCATTKVTHYYSSSHSFRWTLSTSIKRRRTAGC